MQSSSLMRPHEVEVLVGRVLSDVEARRPVEDDARTELKRDWPEADFKTARRIAGHANAARGEEVVWIIGADEKAGAIVGANATDAATWRERLTVHFEGRWSPTVYIQRVPWREVTVVAVVFRTEGRPFVVKRSDNSLEVPWRGSTQVRSAYRHELLSLLSPALRLPHVEVLSARLEQSVTPSTISPVRFRIVMSLYVTPADERFVVLPFHKMRAIILPAGRDRDVHFAAFSADVNRVVSTLATKKVAIESPFLAITPDEVIIRGPSRFRLVAIADAHKKDSYTYEDECVVALELGPAASAASISLRPHFVATSPDADEDAAWVYVASLQTPTESA